MAHARSRPGQTGCALGCEEKTRRALDCWRRRPLIRKPRDVFVYFDNDAQARAPFDAANLQRLLDGRRPQRPPRGLAKMNGGPNASQSCADGTCGAAALAAKRAMRARCVARKRYFIQPSTRSPPDEDIVFFID